MALDVIRALKGIQSPGGVYATRNEALQKKWREHPEFVEIETLLKDDGLGFDANHAVFKLADQCYEDLDNGTKIPRSASTAKCQPLSPICVTKRDAQRAAPQDLVGLMVHELSRHFCVEDTTEESHPLALFVSQNFYDLTQFQRPFERFEELDFYSRSSLNLIPVRLTPLATGKEIFVRFDRTNTDCQETKVTMFGESIPMNEFKLLPLTEDKWSRCSVDHDCAEFADIKLDAIPTRQQIEAKWGGCSVIGKFYSREDSGEFVEVGQLPFQIQRMRKRKDGFYTNNNQFSWVIARFTSKPWRPILINTK